MSQGQTDGRKTDALHLTLEAASIIINVNNCLDVHNVNGSDSEPMRG